MHETELEKELERYKDHLIIVEGRKDRSSLQKLGFRFVFVINDEGKSICEKMEEIEEISRKRKVCILTDFDKKGKKLYLLIKRELSTKNVRLDNSLRRIILREHVTHIEGLAHFMSELKKQSFMTSD